MEVSHAGHNSDREQRLNREGLDSAGPRFLSHVGYGSCLNFSLKQQTSTKTVLCRRQSHADPSSTTLTHSPRLCKAFLPLHSLELCLSGYEVMTSLEQALEVGRGSQELPLSQHLLKQQTLLLPKPTRSVPLQTAT